jgi:hypothetical protein
LRVSDAFCTKELARRLSGRKITGSVIKRAEQLLKANS